MIPAKELMTDAELKKLAKPTMVAPPPAPVDDDPEPILKSRYIFSTEKAFSSPRLPKLTTGSDFQIALPADSSSIGSQEWKATVGDATVQLRVRSSTGTATVPVEQRSMQLAATLVASTEEQAKLIHSAEINSDLRGKAWFFDFSYEVPNPKGGDNGKIWTSRLGGFQGGHLRVWEISCGHGLATNPSLCIDIMSSFRVTEAEASFEKTRAARLTGAITKNPGGPTTLSPTAKATPTSTTSTTTTTTTTAAATTPAVDLCPSLKTLVAGAPDRFAKLRGAKTETGGIESYATTVTVPGALKACSISNGAGLWFASCAMGAKLDEAAAKARVAALTDQVKACVPGWAMTKETSIGEATTFSASKGGVSIKLNDATWARKHDLSIMVLP
jgi:hypothetical protein